jgi:FAD-dependent urate hydroxylase
VLTRDRRVVGRVASGDQSTHPPGANQANGFEIIPTDDLSRRARTQPSLTRALGRSDAQAKIPRRLLRKRAFFGYSARPSGEIYWFANVSRSDEPTRQDLSTITPQAWKRQLLQLFADDAGLATVIIESAGDEMGAYPIHDMPTVPTWHNGPIALAGDAAHATSPNSGQGASIAIEDAIVLAKCLRDVPEHESALATYVQLRRARVEKIVRYSARVGRTKTAGPIGRRLRDLVMPFALKCFANSKAHAWMYTYHIDWSERIEAPWREL